MSLSRRAKRGISILRKLQAAPSRMRNHIRKIAIKTPPAADLSAAMAAVDAMMEANNADLQAVPDQVNNPVAPDAQGGPQHDVPGEPGGESRGEEGA